MSKGMEATRSMDSREQIGFDDLPDQLLTKVFENLDNCVDIANFRACSRKFQLIADLKKEEWPKFLWDELAFCDFGRAYQLVGQVNGQKVVFVAGLKNHEEMKTFVNRRLAETIVDHLIVTNRDPPLEFNFTTSHITAMINLKIDSGFELNKLSYLPEGWNFCGKVLGIESEFYRILQPKRMELKQCYHKQLFNHELKVPSSVETICGPFVQDLDLSAAKNVYYIEIHQSFVSFIMSLLNDSSLEVLMSKYANQIDLIPMPREKKHLLSKDKIGYYGSEWKEKNIQPIGSTGVWGIYEWVHPGELFSIELYLQCSNEHARNFWQIRHATVKPMCSSSIYEMEKDYP